MNLEKGGHRVRLGLWHPDMRTTWGVLTFVAQVVPASSSVAGGALGTGAAVLVRSLADPVAPEGMKGRHSD